MDKFPFRQIVMKPEAKQKFYLSNLGRLNYR